MRIFLSGFALLTLSVSRDIRAQANDSAPLRADVLIVGAGISGLSAAIEAGRAGAEVTLVEMSSVFGGHAVMSEGGVFAVDTPLHRQGGFKDSPELALSEMVAWGGDVNLEWAKYYTENCRTEVHDWLVEIGVVFGGLRRNPGNSVPRFHETKGRGIGLVTPLYQECLSRPNIRFLWNTKITALRSDGGRIRGASAVDLRTGRRIELHAGAVILATGGFQSNLELLRKTWTPEFPFPPRLLLGSGINSQGSGLRLAETVGAELTGLDKQWNYPWGLPDPRDASGSRGLNFRNSASIWVNAAGKRFTNELGSAKHALPPMLAQDRATYWMIFDEDTRTYIQVSGSGWAEFETVEKKILGNPSLVKKAPTIEELAALLGLPGRVLAETMTRYNALVEKGDDLDFSRFGPSSQKDILKTIPPLVPARPLRHPPYYGIQLYPLSRKNNGGIKVDLDCHVLNHDGRVIPGLYAVGELTGSGGMNGRAGLEGVWLGPGVAMGRKAGRAALGDRPLTSDKASATPVSSANPFFVTGNKSCVECHNVAGLVEQRREGYWHFEKVHAAVLANTRNCLECHSELIPNSGQPHRINRLIQSTTCASCHGR